MKKSIIIPCYNEINNISKVIDKVLSKIEAEDNIIIVDDGSSDGTAQFLANIKNENIYNHSSKKWYAVFEGINEIIQ